AVDHQRHAVGLKMSALLRARLVVAVADQPELAIVDFTILRQADPIRQLLRQEPEGEGPIQVGRRSELDERRGRVDADALALVRPALQGVKDRRRQRARAALIQELQYLVERQARFEPAIYSLRPKLQRAGGAERLPGGETTQLGNQLGRQTLAVG